MDALRGRVFEEWCAHSGDGVLAFDTGGNIIVLNAWLAKLLNLRVMPQTTDALLAHVRSLVPALAVILAADPSDSQPQWGSLRIDNCSPKHVTWQRVSIVNDGVPVAKLIIFRDSTTLGHSALSKQSFLSMISHDLRTPLSTILGFAELLHDNRDRITVEEQDEFLGHIIKNANQLSRYAQIALDVMYLEADLQRFDTEAVVLERFVQHWLADVSHRLSARRITFANGHTNDLQALVSPSAMHRILTILVEFALTESDPDGVVEVILDYDDTLAHVLVDHSAPGLTAHEVLNLFAPMQPRDLSEEGRPQLHRLQLYVANLLAERQQGQLTIRNQGGHLYSLDLMMPLVISS